MRKLFLAASALAIVPFAAQAQDAVPDEVLFEPYVGVFGGYHDFDDPTDEDTLIPGDTEGALIGGFAGFNVPVGPVVAGLEGNGAKGFGDLDWEYGATGHIGFRAGESGMIFARAGYQWIEAEVSEFGLADDDNDEDRQRDGVLYGIGFEVGPEEIGLGSFGLSRWGPRLRVNIDTLEFDSLRTTGGVLFHF